MKYFVQRMNFNTWFVVCGPFGCEDTAFIHAKIYARSTTYDGPVRVVTGNGSVVNIL